MSNFSVGIDSPDLARQIELLKLYPEIARRHFYPAMTAATRDMATGVSVPVLSGLAQNTFRAKATGSGVNIEGRVGWWGAEANKAFYIRFVEYGTKRGISPRKFMERAYEAGKDQAEERVALAAERVVNDLAVK